MKKIIWLAFALTLVITTISFFGQVKIRVELG
jgi:hypothetical protein